MSCDLDSVFENAGPGDILIIKDKDGDYVVYARGDDGMLSQCEDKLSRKELCGYLCPSTSTRTYAIPIIVDTEVPDNNPHGMPPIDEIRRFAELFVAETKRLRDRDLRVTETNGAPWALRGSGGRIREDQLPPFVRDLVPPLFRVRR